MVESMVLMKARILITGKVVNMLQLDLPYDSSVAMSLEDINDNQPAQGSESSNVLLVHEQVCIRGWWQDNMYPCHHTIAFFVCERT